MSNTQLLATIRNQDEEIRRLRGELQGRNAVNYEEKYKKALRSIEEIIRANKQIKEELDNLRNMRQVDLDGLANTQREELRKTIDALLKEKSTLVMTLQGLELENEKLKYTVSELENQVSLYKNEKFHKIVEERETLISNQQPEGIPSAQSSPRKSDTRDLAAVLRDKEAEFHRTIENYEEHHSNLTRATKRYEERIGELESKLMSTEKNWRVKLEAKEMEVIEIKAFTRQEFTDQISMLRKENSALKILNNDLSLKMESLEKNVQHNNNYQNYDWEADLVQEMIAVKANLEPLRQQISELQEMNFYEKEKSVRDRTNLQTHVLELQSEVERQNETIKNMEKKILEAHQEKVNLEEKASNLRRLEEENQLLTGKVIVMESREIALKNRSGEELEERILEFESRIELLINNKEGLKEMKDIGIHQLLALKAYILELDSKLKELINSNNHLLRKYKSYKERYQASLKEQKQFTMTINTLKMKILGYDKLVIKLQTELERVVKINEEEYSKVTLKPEEDGKSEIYKKKYELMKEKLEIQEKYKEQEMETLKLNYETKIMELTIKSEELKSLKETIELYRSKNEELQNMLSRKESELFQSKMLSNSKIFSGEVEHNLNNTKQTKDIMNSLHQSLKQNDETIFKLQSELRSKEDTYKRTISRLEREIVELKEEYIRESGKKEIEHNLALDQEAKKHKNRISDLEHSLHLLQLNQKDDSSKKTDELESKLRKVELRAQEAEAKREEEVFNRRRIEKQILDLTHDKEQQQRIISDLQLKMSQLRTLERQNEELRNKVSAGTKQEMRGSFVDYELQGKDNIIRKLNNEILELKSSVGSLGEKDITISSQKNEIFYLKKEIDELNDTINKYNNDIILLKSNLDTNKFSYNSGLENIMNEKDELITRLRKEITAKQIKINTVEEENSKLEEAIRKQKRELNEMEHLRTEIERLIGTVEEKQNLANRLRQETAGYEDQIDRCKREISFIKENFQRVNYELMEKDDQISKLSLEINTVTLRNKEQYDSKYTEEIMEREKQLSKLNAEYQSLKSNVSMIEEEKKYHEDNYKRANNDLFALRSQMQTLDDECSTLRDQVYYKGQEVNKLQFSIESYKQQLEEYAQKEEEVFKMRSEMYTLRNEISNLQDDIYSKEAASTRTLKELSYVREQYSELEQDLRIKQEGINKLTAEITSLRSGEQDTFSSIQQKDNSIMKLTNDLNIARNKYRELQEEMEERQEGFVMLNNQLTKIKGNLAYRQDEIEEKNTQITRMNNEREILRAEIERISEEVLTKNQQVNRAKQETFSLRMEFNDQNHQEKIRIDQQLYMLKNKIGQLEHEIEDKESEIRRIQIQLDITRNTPPPAPLISEQQVQELRMEISKKQRDLINMRFELQEKDYQIGNLTNNINMIKLNIKEYQQRLQNDQNAYESAIREASLKERRLQEEIFNLQHELDSKPAPIDQTRSAVYSITYTEEEMSLVNAQLAQTKRDLNNIKYELQDKLYFIENLQNKAKMQQNLIRQMQAQAEQERARYETQFIQREREVKEQFSAMQQHYEEQIRVYTQQISQIQLRLQTVDYAPAQPEQPSFNVGQYIDEIDRLNRVIKELEEEIGAFKLKLSSMINQEHRIEQNLVTMVLLFTEVESLRDRIKNKETEINEVRKSFIQMTVAGEMESNKMSRLLALAQNNANSEEQIEDLESFDRTESRDRIEPFERINEVHQNLEKSKQDKEHEFARSDVVEDNRSYEQAAVVQDEQHEDHIEEHVEEAAAAQANRNSEQRQDAASSQGRDSLILQLQKEQSNLTDSQVGRGQITIKIQNPGQLIAQPSPLSSSQTKFIQIQQAHQNFVQQPIRIIQQQPQFIQQQLIQQSQHQHQQMMQQGQLQQHFVRVLPQNGVFQGGPPGMIVQQGVMRPMMMGSPINANTQYKAF